MCVCVCVCVCVCARACVCVCECVRARARTFATISPIRRGGAQRHTTKPQEIVDNSIGLLDKDVQTAAVVAVVVLWLWLLEVVQEAKDARGW